MIIAQYEIHAFWDAASGKGQGDTKNGHEPAQPCAGEPNNLTCRGSQIIVRVHERKPRQYLPVPGRRQYLRSDSPPIGFGTRLLLLKGRALDETLALVAGLADAVDGVHLLGLWEERRNV